MRSFSLLGFVSTSLLAVTASAERVSPAPPVLKPATQACLGDLSAFLTCPAGSQRWQSECRSDEPNHGEGAGEHWSGSKRQGPALFLRDDDEKDPAKFGVKLAASYRDHKMNGRVFRFDDQGRLESWSDVTDDGGYWGGIHGLSVTCLPDGRVHYMGYYRNDKLVGSRAWKAKDGSFSYAINYDSNGASRSLDPTPALAQRPDHLCRPVRCDVTAKPDLSDFPK